LAVPAFQAVLVLFWLGRDEGFQAAHGMKQIAIQEFVQLCTGLWRGESLLQNEICLCYQGFALKVPGLFNLLSRRDRHDVLGGLTRGSIGVQNFA